MGCLAAAGIVLGPMVMGHIGGGSFPEFNFLSGQGSKNAFVYTLDGEYKLTYDLEKDNSIDIDYSGADGGFMFFSSDNKFLYYAKNIDSDYSTFTLCRAEYGKLKANSENNESYIETIADHVSLSIRLFGNNVTYIDAYGNLYYYNGEESILLGSNVATYYQDEESNRIVYVTCDESKEENAFSLYGVDLTSENPGENSILIASGADCIADISDFDNILYGIADGDDTRDLYAAGFNKTGEKLVDHVLVGEDNYMYFPMEDGKTYFVSMAEDEMSATIYFYDNGKVSPVQQVYYLAGTGVDGIVFSDDENAADDENLSEHLKVLLKDGSICDLQLPDFVTDAMEWDEIDVFLMNDQVYFMYDNAEAGLGNGIVSAEVKNGNLGEFTKITEDGTLFYQFYDGENLYYLSNKQLDGNDIYYGLYLYDGKESHLIEENFNYMGSYITFYENDVFIDKTFSDDFQSISYSAGHTGDNETGTTTSIKVNGQYMTACVVLDTDEILYCSGDGLYSFNGSSSILMKNNVNQIICNNAISSRNSIWYFENYDLPVPNDYLELSEREEDFLFD